MLVLLPGLICDAAIFAPQLRAFPGARAIDGYGNADSLTDMAQLVLDQAPPRFELLGHSMGGRVALEIMRIAPQRVTRLALVSTGTHGVREGEAEKRHALQERGRSEGFAALVDAWLPPMVGPRTQADPARMADMREMCLRQGQDMYDAHVRALLRRKAADDVLDTITCPTLVMTGELDSWSPPEQHEAIAARIAGADLMILPDTGHMITIESPEAVKRAIAAWLTRD